MESGITNPRQAIAERTASLCLWMVLVPVVAIVLISLLTFWQQEAWIDALAAGIMIIWLASWLLEAFFGCAALIKAAESRSPRKVRTKAIIALTAFAAQ